MELSVQTVVSSYSDQPCAHSDWVGAGRALLACASLMSLSPLSHPVQSIHAFINEQMHSHCVDCVLQYNGNLRHKLPRKVMSNALRSHHGPFFFSFLLFCPLSFTSCILILVHIGSGAVRQLLVCSALWFLGL